MRNRPFVLWFVLIICFLGCDRSDTWKSGELGTDAEFRDVFFADSLNGWMVGGSPFVKGGIIGRTQDGGDTWDFESGIVDQPTSVHLFHINAVEFLDRTTGCAVAAGGIILRTENGGDSWEVVRRGSVASHLFDVDFVEGGYGWAVGLAGVLYTDDAGEHWRRLDGDPRVMAHSVHFIDQWRGWVVGQHGLVLRTGDGGHSWVKVEVPMPEDKPFHFALDFVGDSHGWIVGEGGTILATSDGGLTWNRQQSLVGSFLSAVCFADTLRGWVTGYTRENRMAQVLYTEDGGRNWVVQRRVEDQELLAIDILGGSGWAVGRRVRPAPQILLRMSGSR